MWRKIESFFFEPASPKPLAFLRIGLASCLLIQAALCAGHFFDLYGTSGILQAGLGERFAREPFFSIADWTHGAARLGMGEHKALALLGILYVASLVFLLAGFLTRSAAISVWASHFLLAQGHFTGYGLDLFSHFVLFYSIFMPIGAVFSVDSLWRGAAGPSWQARLSLRVLQFHLSIAYLSTGLEKLSGVQWRNGEAIFRSLMLPTYRQFDLGFLAFTPWLALLFAWGTLLTEIGYPFFIFPQRTRRLWVALTISLHAGIGIFLGLHLFALLMALLTFCCFGLVRETQAVVATIPAAQR